MLQPNYEQVSININKYEIKQAHEGVREAVLTVKPKKKLNCKICSLQLIDNLGSVHKNQQLIYHNQKQKPRRKNLKSSIKRNSFYEATQTIRDSPYLSLTSNNYKREETWQSKTLKNPHGKKHEFEVGEEKRSDLDFGFNIVDGVAALNL